MNQTYAAGDLVFVDADAQGMPWDMEFVQWSMCMQQHTSDASNKPRQSQIFSDLISDIIPQLEDVLLEHL